MTTEQRISALLTAPAGTLARIDAILSGKIEAAAPQAPARLLTHSEAARRLSVSRCTVWRMEKEGVLSVVEIRPGVFRVPESAITALAGSARPRVVSQTEDPPPPLDPKELEKKQAFDEGFQMRRNGNQRPSPPYTRLSRYCRDGWDAAQAQESTEARHDHTA